MLTNGNSALKKRVPKELPCPFCNMKKWQEDISVFSSQEAGSHQTPNLLMP